MAVKFLLKKIHIRHAIKVCFLIQNILFQLKQARQIENSITLIQKTVSI